MLTVAHAAELAGRRVRVIILSDKPEPSLPEALPPLRPSSGRSLLRHAGTWAGDDFEECLQLVNDTRSDVEF
ncbi:MAG TPA: hypothetical protein DCE56_04155 [Cyanobacteria bacterium UBA8553]|nr:hypothetical protein [Cyanobacteria bacterium UBA8553]HAJ64727.1 hypothetical protein [Cyanobacteria bacterium UBA8543]